MPSIKLMKIMIVDDERPARDKLRRLLAQETDIVSIVEARDGVEALEIMNVEVPDVVFLDIQMPEVSGTNSKLLNGIHAN
jgi:two-component system LytT family response regulator